MDFELVDSGLAVPLDLGQSWCGRARVLVVEDDEDVAQGLRWLLSRSYDVRAESAAMPALQRCREFCPDLLVVDYRLPDLDGVEFLALIQEGSPVQPASLMISAYHACRSPALRHGYGGFLAKPFSESELLHAVDRLLGH